MIFDWECGILAPYYKLMPVSAEQPLRLSERDRGLRYVDIMKRSLEGSHVLDYLKWDHEGDLWLDGVRMLDVVIKAKGTPLEIVDTRIIKRRADEWVDLTQRIAREVGYTSGFKYHYAAKANMSVEVTHAAYAAGWLQETTQVLDLHNIQALVQEGLLRKEKVDIICNGFFFPSDRFAVPDSFKEIKSRGVVFHTDGNEKQADEQSYLATIEAMRDQGYRITPIIYDLNELKYLLTKKGAFNIGLRLKFGKVTNDRDLIHLPSRFGMTWEQIQEAADIADSSDNQLRFTMLHAMVGAAENMPIDVFEPSLQFAADKYFALRAKHPSLQYLNIGGGMPPKSEKYNHAELLRRFLRGVKDKAKRANLPEPTIVFELGSYIAAEAGFDILKIIGYKQNHIDQDGNPGYWGIGDTSLVATIPDVWFLPGKEFMILAVNNANCSAKLVSHGDLTCDSGSILPKGMLIPDTTKPQWMGILGTNAYQNVLAGEGGAGHCGLTGSIKFKIQTVNGRPDVYSTGRQTVQDVGRIQGYTMDRMKHLKRS